MPEKERKRFTMYTLVNQQVHISDRNGKESEFRVNKPQLKSPLCTRYTEDSPGCTVNCTYYKKPNLEQVVYVSYTSHSTQSMIQGNVNGNLLFLFIYTQYHFVCIKSKQGIEERQQKLTINTIIYHITQSIIKYNKTSSEA